MGQFYKGTEATFLDDKMYKAPYELMGQVLAKKDKEVEEAAKAKDALSAMLEAKGLKVDDPRLQEIIGGYTNQVGDISAGIYGDAMNAATYMPKIEELKRKITADWKMGDVYKIQGNREAYLENVKSIREDAKKNPDKYIAGQEEALIAKALADYKGFKDVKTGEYVDYKNQNLFGTDPVTEHVEKAIKGAVGEFTEVERDNESGGLRIKVDNKWQGWKPQDLANIFSNYVKANPNIDSALMQREMLGLSNRNEEIKAGFDYMVNKYHVRQVKESSGRSMSEQGKMDYAHQLKEQDDASKAILGMSETFDTTGNTNKDVYVDKPMLGTNGRPKIDRNGKVITQKVKLAPLDIWNQTVKTHSSEWTQGLTVANESIKGLATRLGPGVLTSVNKILADPKVQVKVSRGDFSTFTDIFNRIASNKNIPIAERQQMLNQVESQQLNLKNKYIDSQLLGAKQTAYVDFRNTQLKAQNKPLIKSASQDPKGFNSWLNSSPAINGWGLNNVNMKGSAALAGLSKEEQKDLNHVGEQNLNMFSFSVDQFKNIKLTDSKGKSVNLDDIAKGGKLSFKDLVDKGVITPSTKSVTQMENVISEVTGLSSQTKQTYNMFVNGKPVEVFTSDFLPLDRKNNKGEDALGTGINIGPGIQVVATLPVSQLSNSKIQDMLQKTSGDREYMYRMNSWPAEAKVVKTVGGKKYEISRDYVTEITKGKGPEAPKFSTTEGYGKELVQTLLYH
jgi:hypothetical protein